MAAVPSKAVISGPHFVEWGKLTPERAREIAELWWSNCDSRLAWLDSQLPGGAGPDDQVLVRAWSWWLRMVEDRDCPPSPTQPLPAWVIPEFVRDPRQRAGAVASDALVCAYAAYLHRLVPRLEWDIDLAEPRFQGKNRMVGENEPVLVAPANGGGWLTFPISPIRDLNNIIGMTELNRLRGTAQPRPRDLIELADRRAGECEQYILQAGDDERPLVYEDEDP